ncbi:MAG: hypothetical protein QOG95_5153 [Mycobacterium sp.]|nr:hypothetical protein [Mycobacterium sp.]
MSVVIVMSRPTDWARAIGVVARVTSMGAAATGFAIGMSTLHYAAPSLDAASISHDRFATGLCTDNPEQQAQENSEQANQHAQQSEDQAARTFELANEADQLAQHARHNARHLQRV